MFAAVGRFLSNIAGPSGTLVVLDDLQWAGDDALDLLSSLVREQSSRPVCVLGACRSTEVHQGDVLSALLVDLARDGMLSQMGIDVLARPEAAELLRTLLEGGEDPSVVERVLQRSGGVPFFLVSCARALHVGALGEVPANVPWDAAESIRQRVAALPAVSRQLLGVAAAVGRTATRALIATVLERAEDEVLTLAEESCEARLLLESGAEAYEFAHDLIREVVESDLSAGRRRLLHRRIAGALEQSATAAAPEVVAFHYEQGGVVGKAVGYLEQAAIVAQHTGAFVEARRHMEHALALAPQEDHLRLQEQLGDCAAMGEAALAGYQQALKLWRQLPLADAGHLHDELTGARLLRKLLTCYQRTSFAVSVQWSHEELEALAAEMIHLAEATGDEDELWCARLVNLALLKDSGPITAEVTEARRAVSLSAADYFEAQGNWIAFSQAMEGRIGAIWDAGAFDEAIAAAKHWFAIAQLPPLERGQAFARVITMCELLGRYDDALALAGQMVAQIRPGEPVVHLNDGFQHATLAAWLSGHWSEHEEIMAMISQVWEQVQYSPRVVNMLGGYETALIIARAREDQNAVDTLIPVLEHILSAEWRSKNLALIAAHMHDDPGRLDLTVPLTSLPMLTIHTLMFLSERNLTAPSAFLEAARAQSEATTWDALHWCVVVAEALAAGDHATLDSAIDEAEIHGLAPHAARMRIVLAEHTADRSVLERARSTLERLGDHLFLRRLEAVAVRLSQV
jgi:tetratricopeptide (TPR) repeat protein